MLSYLETWVSRYIDDIIMQDELMQFSLSLFAQDQPSCILRIKEITWHRYASGPACFLKIKRGSVHFLIPEYGT